MKKRSLFSSFCSYYKPYKFMFFLDLLAAAIMSLCGIFYPILSRKIFTDYVKLGESAVTKIIISTSILLGVYIVRALLEYFVTYYGHKIGVCMQRDMRKELFAKYEDLPFKYYDNHEIGDLMSRITSDLQDISELAHHGPENIFVCGFTILGSFVYLLTINYILALILFAIVPILILLSALTNKKRSKAFDDSKAAVGKINARVESSLSGIRVTKAFNNKELEILNFEESNKDYVKARLAAYKYMGYFHSVSGLTMNIFNVVCITCGALIVIYTKIFTIEDYLAFAISISLFIKPIETLVKFVEQFEDGVAGFKRYIEVIDIPLYKEKDSVIKDINLKGNIEFRNVNFRYDDEVDVINNVSFNIKQGDCIALVGTSGGGKTTICHLIPNFYHVEDNKIFFDGIDINDISIKTLRDNIGIVEQDVFLFNDTIRNNIRYAKLNATEEEIIDAAKKANIYDFIMSLPKKFDSVVGERGVKLSGGEKQRISIARIFLKNPSILILDEATSALDNTTEIEIQKSLNELSIGRTAIIVAHRLSTIKHANKIFVIEEGKILEKGNHQSLMKKKGRYYNLYNQQFRLN